MTSYTPFLWLCIYSIDNNFEATLKVCIPWAEVSGKCRCEFGSKNISFLDTAIKVLGINVIQNQ